MRQGTISNLTNPKAAAFFPSLLPQFAARDSNLVATLLALGAVFALMTLTWLSAYAFAITRCKGAFERTGIRRAFDAVTGGALLAFGPGLGLEEAR
jgi:threonine/homoserine/homoserine lactone efflux protein